MFVHQEVEMLRHATRKRKNQGELSVYEYVRDNCEFNEAQIALIKYFAEECKRQHSGERSVYDLAIAWTVAMAAWPNRLDLNLIKLFGTLVEPDVNRRGFREIPIGVETDGIWHPKAPWDRVIPQLEHLIDSYYEGLLEASHGLSAHPVDQFYFEYENIHPFVDGNGRTGKIIYNYLLGKLAIPLLPPPFWGDKYL